MFWVLLIILVLVLWQNQRLRAQARYIKADTIQFLADLSTTEEGREELAEYGFEFGDLEDEDEDVDDLLADFEEEYPELTEPKQTPKPQENWLSRATATLLRWGYRKTHKRSHAKVAH